MFVANVWCYANSVALEAYHITDLAGVGKIDTTGKSSIDSSGNPRMGSHSWQMYAKFFTRESAAECYWSSQSPKFRCKII